MVAPPIRRGIAASEARQEVLVARRVAASALLRDDTQRIERPARVASWWAWLFAGWVVLVTAAYFAAMLGML